MNLYYNYAQYASIANYDNSNWSNKADIKRIPTHHTSLKQANKNNCYRKKYNSAEIILISIFNPLMNNIMNDQTKFKNLAAKLFKVCFTISRNYVLRVKFGTTITKFQKIQCFDLFRSCNHSVELRNLILMAYNKA